MPRQIAGSEQLPYHELIRIIPTEYIDSTLWERPETVVVGLFSHNDRGKKDPEEEERVLEKGTQELNSKVDVAKCMTEVWNTSALVNLDYSKLKEIYEDLNSQVQLELRFSDPREFYRRPLRDRIQEGESMLDEEEQGFARLLKTLQILETILEFLDDYSREFNKLVQAKSYTNLIDLLIDILESEWGKNLYQYLESKNIEIM